MQIWATARDEVRSDIVRSDLCKAGWSGAVVHASGMLAHDMRLWLLAKKVVNRCLQQVGVSVFKL